MNSSMRHIWVIFRKDLIETLKSMNRLAVVLLSVIFAILYNWVIPMGKAGGPGFVLTLVTLMNLCMVPAVLVSMMIAEEKEKNTLRTLMLSNVSAMEFLLGKVLVCFVVLTGVNIALFFICGMAIGYLIPYLLLIGLGSIPLLFLGAWIGILVKDQQAAGTYSTPFLLILILPTFLGQLNPVIAKIASFIPTSSLMTMMGMLFKNDLFGGDFWFNLIVLIVWIIITYFLFVTAFKKKGLDN